MLIEKLKCNYSDGSPFDEVIKVNFSIYLREAESRLHLFINLFSEVQGTTIEHLSFLIKRNGLRN
jgi:hypothetical protein